VHPSEPLVPVPPLPKPEVVVISSLVVDGQDPVRGPESMFVEFCSRGFSWLLELDDSVVRILTNLERLVNDVW
jgi:hypothetical protein